MYGGPRIETAEFASSAAASPKLRCTMRPNLTGNPLLDLDRVLLGAGQRRIPPVMRAWVMRRDSHTCSYCPAPAQEIDHVVPWEQGGPTALFNLVAACQPCNRQKGNRTPVEWAAAKQRKAAQMAALRKRPLVKAKRKPRRKARRIPGYQPPTPTLAQLLRASQSPSRPS